MSTPSPYEPPSGQPPYGYGYPPPNFPGPHQSYGRPAARNGLAITSLVLGIAALVTSWLTLPGIILGILAVIFGAIGLARARADRVSNKGLAIAGLITGVLGLVIGTVLLIVAIRVASDCTDQYGRNITEQQLQSCIEDNIGG